MNNQSQPTQRVLVEDSVTHQAGEGMTARRPDAIETPDIFDNSPQSAIKTQTSDDTLIDDKDVVVLPEATTATLKEAIQGNNDVAPMLETLTDGSVDIPR
ncbi:MULTISPECIES: hypothetical protein [unclassified Moraxella]|uniref:hypothetical protein n=1 Tax=unclassified Moraxella TaxID=2685852 RepID=UPI003AF7F742